MYCWPPPQACLQVWSSSEHGGQVSLPVTEGMNNKLKTVPLRFSLALSNLPTGKYNCQVTVIDPTSQKATFWQAPVMLVP